MISSCLAVMNWKDLQEVYLQTTKSQNDAAEQWVTIWQSRQNLSWRSEKWYMIYINKTIINGAFLYWKVYIAKAHQRYKYEGLATCWVKAVSYKNVTTTWSSIILEQETERLVPEWQVQIITYRLTRMVQGMTVPALWSDLSHAQLNIQKQSVLV